MSGSEIKLGNTPNLEESLYSLNPEETAFYQAQTGIQDEQELKAHIMNVQRQAFAVHPYPCIQRFAFTRLKISRLHGYPQVLEIGRSRDNPILLDIGCCFGNDIRKAIADGFPAAGCVGSDLRPEFWDLGHALFKSTPSSFPVPFVAGDAFDKAMISPEGPTPPAEVDSPVKLSELPSHGSLNALIGRVDVIHASSFFHLFKEEQQAYLAQALGSLLSQKPGSLILGSHGGLMEKGYRPSMRQDRMFCHSPASWQELWEGVLGKDHVRVDAKIIHEKRPDFQTQAYGETRSDWQLLVWTVTRV